MNHIDLTGAEGFEGTVHRPGEHGYDEKRRALYPDLDPRPAVVAEAFDTADVQRAIAAAQTAGVPFAVQATGHGTRVPADDGVLLKTSSLRSVLIDPDRQVARVRPGARWGDVLEAARPFGLAPLSGSSPDVGVVGYTLGGGVGWLARKHGFAADSVLKAEVVTADGRRRVASRHEHPDLFWALRGGGANFGVVTGLEFRLYPVRQVYAGILRFPTSSERAAEILAAYRDWSAGLPDEMSTAVILSQSGLALKILYAGDPASAEHLLAPMRRVTGSPVEGALRPMEYADASMGGTPARYLDFLDDLPDAVIHVLLRLLDSGVQTIELRHWAGAMSRPGADAGPVRPRVEPYSVIIDTPIEGPLADALRAYGTGGTFLNFLADPTRVESAYTPRDLRRLREVKQAYDPDNFFRIGHNISPSPAPAIAQAST